MTTELNRDAGMRFLLVITCFTVVVAGMKAAASLLLPFLVAVFLALISLPLLNWLQDRGLPTGLAVFLTVVVAIAVLVGIVVLIGGSIKEFTAAAPRYADRWQVLYRQVLEWLDQRGIQLSEQTATELIDVSKTFELVSGTLRGVAAVLSNVLMVLLIIIFILAEAAGFPAKLTAAFGPQAASERLAKIRSEVQRYLGIKTLISLATGSLVAAAMAIIQVDQPDVRQPGRTLLHGPPFRTVHPGRLRLVGLLGLGLGPGRDAALRPADDDPEDHAGKLRGVPLGGGSARRRPAAPEKGRFQESSARTPAVIGADRFARSISIVALAVVLATACGSGNPVNTGGVTDEGGPRNVVVLAPAAAEILDALELSDRVVAVGDFGPWPESLAGLPVVGGYASPSAERILSLHCDLLVTTHSEAALPAHDQLRSLGVDVLALRTDTYRGIHESLLELGRRFDRAPRARELSQTLRGELEELAALGSTLPRRSVLFVVGQSPLYVAGPGSHIDEMIEKVGGANVAHDALSPYQQVSLESILARGPEVIIDTSDNRTGAPRGRVAGDWGRWEFLPAVRERRVYHVAPGRLVIPGIRLPEMTRLMGRLIHPEAFGEASAVEMGVGPPSGTGEASRDGDSS